MPKRLKNKHEAEPVTDAPAPERIGDFKTLLSAHMAQLGSKGGKIGGKRRLETMSAKERRAVAMRAAAARWKKKDRP
jgi:hypothetical protein